MADFKLYFIVGNSRTERYDYNALGRTYNRLHMIRPEHLYHDEMNGWVFLELEEYLECGIRNVRNVRR